MLRANKIFTTEPKPEKKSYKTVASVVKKKTIYVFKLDKVFKDNVSLKQLFNAYFYSEIYK